MSKEKIEVGDWVQIKGFVPEKYRNRFAKVSATREGWMDLSVGSESGVIALDHEVERVSESEVPDEIRFKGHPSTHSVVVNPVSPDHYSYPGGVQVIDLTRHMDFLLGNVVKYVARAGRKGNRLEDLKKAETYLRWAIEDEEAK